MKKAISILLTLTLTLALCACGAPAAQPAPTPTPPAETTAQTPVQSKPAQPDEPDVTAAPAAATPITLSITPDERWYHDGDTLLLHYLCPTLTISGTDDDAAANAQLALLRSEFERIAECGDIDAVLEQARLAIAERGAPSFAVECAVTVQRISEHFVSLLSNIYVDRGGVHGSTLLRGLTVDRSGRRVALADLSAQPEKFLDFLRESVLAQMDEYRAGLYEFYRDEIDQVVSEDTWYLDERGLVFIGNQYVIAPYVAGIFEFVVPYAELAGFLNPEFLPADDAAGTPDAEPPVHIADGSASRGIPNPIAEFEVTPDGGRFAVWFDRPVTNVRFDKVHYDPYDERFAEEQTLWISSSVEELAAIVVTDMFETLPQLRLRFTENGAVYSMFITQSGEDGSMLLVNEEGFFGE